MCLFAVAVEERGGGHGVAAGGLEAVDDEVEVVFGFEGERRLGRVEVAIGRVGSDRRLSGVGGGL